MNTEIISYLQKRTEDAAKRLQSVNEQISKLNVERETLVADIDGYKRTLAAETRESAIHTVQTQIEASAASDLAFQDQIALDLGTTKAEFTRQFIRSRAISGVTPADIIQGFHDANIKITRAYVYSLVQRLASQGAIRKQRGR